MVLLISAFLFGEFSGFEAGIEASLTSGGEKLVSFGSLGPSVYETFANMYLTNVVLSSVNFGILALTRRISWVRGLIYILMTYPFIFLIAQKRDLIARGIKYNGLMEWTICLDYLGLALVILLLLVAFAPHVLNWSKNIDPAANG